MTRFTIFTILLVVQFTVGISVSGVVEIFRDINLHTQENNQVKNCKLETSTGEEHQYTPLGTGSASYGDHIEFPYFSHNCDIRIRNVQLEDAGVWKITTYFTTSDRPPVTKEFKLFVTQNIAVVPDPVTITEGYFAHAELDLDKSNVTSCTLQLYSIYNYADSMQIDLLNEKTEDFQRFGQCGFQMLARSNITYTPRILTAIVEDKIIYTGNVEINIRSNIEEPEKMEIIQLDRGKSGKVSFSAGGRSVRFCQLEGPMGLETSFYGDCVYNIPVVTSRHDGIWIARYGIRGNPVPVIERFRVVVRDAKSIDTKVTVTKNSEVQLSCHVYGKQGAPTKFCYFTRPDGYVLNLENGIGTENYTAYNLSSAFFNIGLTSNVYCNLIIRQPKQYDYGGWTCGIGSYNFIIGSRIYVDPRIINANETGDKEVEVIAENVYVKRKDSFEIKCTADTVLSYCWLQSPNGTSYSVSKDTNQSPTTLPYVGLGLKFGECIVKIDHATHTDHGEWTCNLGVSDGPEKSQKFFVNVTESYIIPEHSILMANYEDDITLSCSILPNLTDKEVVYCRWIHPDGHGIHNSLSQRYMVSQTDTQCRLMIPSEYSEESVGRWTCVAGLRGLVEEEAWATINVYSQSTTYLATIISIIATLVMVLCISSYIYVRRKRRTLSEDSSCVYNNGNFVQFFGKLHLTIPKCNKSIDQTIVE